MPPQRLAGLEQPVRGQRWSGNDHAHGHMERKPCYPHNPQGQSCRHFLAICSRRIMAFHRQLSKLLSD